MVDFNVNGKIAVVTGGTRGLGLYTAEAYVINGASTVVITSRKEKACQEAKNYLEDLAESNGNTVKIVAISADLTNEDDCNRFYEETMQAVDKVDILVANAGATWGAPLENHPVSAFKKVLDLNVVAVFQTIKLFAADLEKAGSPEDPLRILIMSSVASLAVSNPFGTYGYLASKSGVSHMGKNLALQLGPKNITVNSLAPGFFPSRMSKGLLEVVGDMMKELNPRRRLGEKEDLMNAVVFLSSKQSNYINGIVFPIDGGAHLNVNFMPKI